MAITMEGHPAVDRNALIRLDRDGTPFLIRDLRPEDRAVLTQFYHDFEPKRAAQGLPPAEPHRVTRWLDTILRTGMHKVVLRETTLVGHSFITPTRRPGIGEYAIFLREDQRGHGLGTELNRIAITSARDVGLNGLWLTVEPDNRAAIRSYQKAGFRFVPSTVMTIEPEMEVLF